MEFALVLPLLALCIAGLAWVGTLMLTQIQIEHAAREGARAAVVDPERAVSLAGEAVRRSVSGAEVMVDVGPEFIAVTVRQQTASIPLVAVGERNLAATAHMRREDLIDR